MNPSDPKGHEKFIRINEAYTVLSRPSSRREYDVSLAARFHSHQNHLRNVYHSTSTESHAPGTDGPQATYPGSVSYITIQQ